MSQRIYRHEVPVDDNPHVFPLHGDPISVGCRQPTVVEFWSIHQTGYSVQDRAFIVVGTGHPFPPNVIRYWGTATAPGGHLVWHLLEVKP